MQRILKGVLMAVTEGGEAEHCSVLFEQYWQLES
jgi:hypothetical protein